MGSDATPDYALSGIGIPRRFSTTLADDHQSGLIYTEAERRPGSVTFSGDNKPRMVIRPSGLIDDSVQADCIVKVTRPGSPGPLGAGVVAKLGTSGTWYGAGSPLMTSGAQRVRAGAANNYYLDAGIVGLDDGTAVASSIRVTSTTSVLAAHVRDVDGVWSLVAIRTLTDTISRRCCIVAFPDGALHIYWAADIAGANTARIALYRREAGNTTWTLQTDDACGAAFGTGVTRLRAGVISGQVVLFISNGTGAYQYVSSNGGMSFSAVGSVQASVSVVDVATVGSDTLLAMTSEVDGTRNTYVRRLSDGTGSIWASPTLVEVASTTTVAQGGWFIVTETGEAVAVAANGSNNLVTAVSLDGGATWDGTTASIQAGSTDYCLSRGQSTTIRGQVIAIGVDTDTSGARNGASLTELQLGGRNTFPLLSARLGVPVGDVRQFTLVGELNEQSWPDSDSGGTPTRTFSSQTGTNVVTGVGVTANNEDSSAGSTDEILSIICCRVNSGTATIRAHAADVEVRIDLTTTTAVAYDASGAAGSTTAIDMTEFVEFKVVANSQSDAAYVAYRVRDEAFEREWTELDALTSIGASSSRIGVKLTVDASSDVDWLFGAWYINSLGSSGLDTGPASDGSNLAPITLSPVEPVTLLGGFLATASGGPAPIDGNTYTISRDGSQYRKDNLLPDVAPSPSRPWRSAGTSSSPLSTTTGLYFSLDPVAGNASRWREEVAAIYLDGLVGVPQFVISDSASSLATVDLRTTINYANAAGEITMSASGSVTVGPYVAAGSLAGCYFEFANGKVRKITENTSGSLTYGSTIAEKRPQLTLEGIDGTEDASGTGYIWPKRALVLFWTNKGAFTRLDIGISNSVRLGPEGYREIGLLAITEVMVLGRAFDRNSSHDVQANTTLTEQLDGSSSVATHGPIGGTYEFAYVDSHTDTTQIYRTSSSPDYVTIDEAASPGPAGTRYAVTADVEGAYRALGGNQRCALFLPRIPAWDGVGDSYEVYTSVGDNGYPLGLKWGRIASRVRREQIPIGFYHLNAGERLATIAVREEP
jgi:hypothetical protein